jgi:hypothetical protein
MGVGASAATCKQSAPCPRTALQKQFDPRHVAQESGGSQRRAEVWELCVWEQQFEAFGATDGERIGEREPARDASVQQ